VAVAAVLAAVLVAVLVGWWYSHQRCDSCYLDVLPVVVAAAVLAVALVELPWHTGSDDDAYS